MHSNWQSQPMVNFSDQTDKLETKNLTEPNITSLFEAALLYLSGQENIIPNCADQYLHSDILQVKFPSIILGLLPVSLIKTHKFH